MYVYVGSRRLIDYLRTITPPEQRNVIDGSGGTLLHLAAKITNLYQRHILRFCLNEWGVDPFIYDRYGHRAIDYIQHFPTVEYLRSQMEHIRKYQ